MEHLSVEFSVADRGLGRIGVMENDPRTLAGSVPTHLHNGVDPVSGIRGGCFPTVDRTSDNGIVVSRIPMTRFFSVNRINEGGTGIAPTDALTS